ncbi:bifunctional glutamine amidotransferase/anthranilate phosphoribosyltransferase [mine drainage metagenome]|uniref:anthranilate phosphoribosyltransferase n=1 Tax=mine drainage metagenome TaxID=410659 RepID=T1BQW8_9ZZZZ
MDCRLILEKLLAGIDLEPGEVSGLFQLLVKGELDPARLAAVLVGLRIKGESGAEIASAARVFLESAQPFTSPDYDFADTCGTGGDDQGTLNISSAVAFLAPACGLPIAKHGNRSVSSKTGSADVLEQLGIPTTLTPEISRRSLDEAGFCFLFAPGYHPGLRHAMPVRRALGIRTLFNFMGPLINPARPPFQLVGVYDAERILPMAHALDRLGCKAAAVVHGAGLDEIALHAPTQMAILRAGRIETLTLEPESLGVPYYPIEALQGADPKSNALELEALLTGSGRPAYAWSVALNTGVLLWIAGRAADPREGVHTAYEALREGRARKHLQAAQGIVRGA